MTTCKHYGGNRLNENGIQGKKQRYYYRDCKRTFREGEDKRKKYNDDFKIEVVKWYLENVGIRSMERRMNVTDTTILRWIKQFGKIVKNKLYTTADSIDEENFKKENIEILEIDELVTYVKKIQK